MLCEGRRVHLAPCLKFCHQNYFEFVFVVRKQTQTAGRGPFSSKNWQCGCRLRAPGCVLLVAGCFSECKHHKV